jgi:hypothetical protein
MILKIFNDFIKKIVKRDFIVFYHIPVIDSILVKIKVQFKSTTPDLRPSVPDPQMVLELCRSGFPTLAD